MARGPRHPARMAPCWPIFALKAIGFVRFYRRARRPAALPASVSMAGRFVRAVAAPRSAPVNPLI
ncbi:hypothetical protein Sp245p_15465 (plasmid) [Azospirillum baldaniorum]|uniref:Uncharacterized protein n=1 Tax=Azospirillum baldaniorum TaxID=1064539 RepID=A0A9P1JWU7_9PROT|nr:hypothetical protein Sp245p_15465 [Azospirillum baldaniorum]CCD01308.1 protein of unknown function [Azospirillum baldaniorum]